jgi:hypothetical protein
MLEMELPERRPCLLSSVVLDVFDSKSTHYHVLYHVLLPQENPDGGIGKIVHEHLFKRKLLFHAHFFLKSNRILTLYLSFAELNRKLSNNETDARL